MRSAPMTLDFIRRGGSLARLGSWLLVLGLVAVGVSLLMEREAADALSAREAEVDQLRSIARRASPALSERASDSPEIREQIKRANDVLAQMNIPWGDLFAAVESAQDPTVSLLAVSPDIRTRTVQIAGQGRDLPAVLAYMERLQATKLQDVVLATHEAKVREPGQPVEFTVLARWMEAR